MTAMAEGVAMATAAKMLTALRGSDRGNGKLSSSDNGKNNDRCSKRGSQRCSGGGSEKVVTGVITGAEEVVVALKEKVVVIEMLVAVPNTAMATKPAEGRTVQSLPGLRLDNVYEGEHE